MIDQRMTKIDNKMEQIFQQQIGTDAKIANVQKALDEMVVRQDQFDGSLGQMAQEIDKLREENAQLSSKVEAIHRKSTLHNIRIFDFPIRDGEANSELDLKAAFQNYAKEKLNLEMELHEINRMYFTGRGRNKHLVVEFVLWQSKRNVMAHLKNLKTTDPRSKVTFCDDLTQRELMNKKANLPMFKQLKARAGPNDVVELRRGDIFINRARQSPQDLHSLQRHLHNNYRTGLNQDGNRTMQVGRQRNQQIEVTMEHQTQNYVTEQQQLSSQQQLPSQQLLSLQQLPSQQRLSPQQQQSSQQVSAQAQVPTQPPTLLQL